VKNNVEIINGQRAVSIKHLQKKLIEKTVDAVLEFEGIDYPCEVSVTFVGEKKIKELNSEFRNIDRITDVLSFPSGEFPKAEEEETCYLGDIAICAARALEQSLSYGHSFEREIAFLTAHSCLHLLGYDHMEENEEIEMFAKQEAILTKMGINR